MSLCIATGAGVLALAATGFTLDWTHSVERTAWHEVWEVTPGGLRPVEGRVAGSGAGMEVPEGATFRDGAWHYRPALAPQREVWLAASGATPGGWRLCAGDACLTLGAEPGPPVRLWSAPDCAPPPP